MVFQYLRISGECHNSFAVSATMSVCSEDWMMELMCFGCHELSQFFCPPVPHHQQDGGYLWKSLFQQPSSKEEGDFLHPHRQTKQKTQSYELLSPEESCLSTDLIFLTT
uniref:Uncharacterized protein n=1 Tax=Populus trichocarpa TaxID=3694 RepID=A0A2K1Z3P0_POPTR